MPNFRQWTHTCYAIVCTICLHVADPFFNRTDKVVSVVAAKDDINTSLSDWLPSGVTYLEAEKPRLTVAKLAQKKSHDCVLFSYKIVAYMHAINKYHYYNILMLGIYGEN